MSRLVKALSVQQPWAECIARGDKRVENRRRNVRYRGPLAIHASLTWSAPGGHTPRVVATLTGALHHPLTHHDAARYGLAFGAVIAVAELVDCHPARGGCCGPWGEPDAHHLVLTRIERLPSPVPARGQLGLWEIGLPSGGDRA
ncbi:hypothetical protein [Pseudonocardia zijingensis]|uniref:ASCH domain-containing protein n=1 Tax=Pseudonocardia zijingensis TaxID=153376 RepID=A0ABN1NFR8_9PSEU